MPRIDSSSILSEYDRHLFEEGSHVRLYEKLGAHRAASNDLDATRFALWAPNARAVSLIGEFNEWDPTATPLERSSSGIWECSVESVETGALYKYRITRADGSSVDKADPYAFLAETPPATASRVWSLNYEWSDVDWMDTRGRQNSLSSPITIYEMHLGSWRRRNKNRPLTYRQLAVELPPYLRALGFTHVEFLPVTEHPFYGSWGYMVSGYFAPTSRYGTPQDFMHLIDCLHQNGIGVILDWVPYHFATDEFGLGNFDGTHLYEHADPERRIQPDWKSYVFDYSQPEVRSFLISSAMFWLDRYHADGLRVDAVTEMLDDPDAVRFLHPLNREIRRSYPDVLSVAEESGAREKVTHSGDVGGLEFGLKWDIGWARDVLQYVSQDFSARSEHHDALTFRSLYAHDENFVLPFSHDDFSGDQKSLLTRMPGDEWQRLAGLRLVLAWMYAQPGKKLLFMGAEFGQLGPWAHDEGLEWDVLASLRHRMLSDWVRDLNHVYRTEPTLHRGDCVAEGFEWIDGNDVSQNVVSFIRAAEDCDDTALVICNFNPLPRQGYRIGVPEKGFWKELLNSDAGPYGGSGRGNLGGLETLEEPSHGRPYTLELTLPPLAALFFKHEGE